MRLRGNHGVHRTTNLRRKLVVADDEECRFSRVKRVGRKMNLQNARFPLHAVGILVQGDSDIPTLGIIINLEIVT